MRISTLVLAALGAAVVLGSSTASAATAPVAGGAAPTSDICLHSTLPLGNAVTAGVIACGPIVGACTHVLGFYGPCAEIWPGPRLYLRILGGPV